MSRRFFNRNQIQPIEIVHMEKVATIYISTTYTLDTPQKYYPENSAELRLYKDTPDGFTKSIQAFFGDKLPVKIVNGNQEISGNQIRVADLNDNCYLHCRAEEHHILVRVYDNDERGIEALRLMRHRLSPPPPRPPSND